MEANGGHGWKFSIYLPDPLATDLKRLAAREANRPSATARRLIAAGLRAAARADRDEAREDHEAR
jgi:hypothetical protein